MTIDQHTQSIINWRESMSLLPDAKFFELMRIYLGKVQTPFNKQNLIENLAAFLRKQENKLKIVRLLNADDLKIIAAVKCLADCTQEKLEQFFQGTYTSYALYDKIYNLEERLILFRHTDARTKRVVIQVNPHLEEVLAPVTGRQVLLEPAACAVPVPDDRPPLTPELLAAFVSFSYDYPDLCKGDGTFKKRVRDEIERIFPGAHDVLSLVARAFIQLAVLKETSKGYSVDKQKFLHFAELNEALQRTYLAVAANGHVTRTELVRQGQLLLETAKSVPPEGYTRATIMHAAFLVAEEQNSVPGMSSVGYTGRFAAAMERESRWGVRRQKQENVFVPLFDNAVALGMFVPIGTTAAGEEIYTGGAVLDTYTEVRPQFFPRRSRTKDKEAEPAEDAPKVLTVDAAFTVTLMPGLPLKSLVPLMNFLRIVQYDTAARFEITRKSAMRAFDEGQTAEQVFALLAAHCAYEIPQNIKISLEEWSQSYSSAALYKGYVLRVSGELATLTEKNRAIAPYIAETIAPGIFLLSVSSDEEAARIIDRSGLDFIGKTKTADEEHDPLGFPELYLSDYKKAPEQPADAPGDRPPGDRPPAEPPVLSTEEERAEHIKRMLAVLDTMRLTSEQRECLELRINRRTVITEEQLRADSVKFEILEAGGMDFAGKVRVAEDAIANNNSVELSYEDERASGGIKRIVGFPLSIERTGRDAEVTVKVHPEGAEKKFSVAKARLVKRLRTTVL